MCGIENLETFGEDYFEDSPHLSKKTEIPRSDWECTELEKVIMNDLHSTAATSRHVDAQSPKRC